MAAKATTTTPSRSSRGISRGISSGGSATLLCYAAIVAFTASLVLSVDAIRCHQCNSHINSDCIGLRLSTPRALLDSQFLRECEGENAAEAFCRKTVLSIDANGEHRIVRSCGWHDEQKTQKNSCFDADTEGLKQTICSCFTDGCNAAPARLGNQAAVFGLAAFCVLVAVVLRRSV